ncbi:hypothetical protein FIBSPDRAFT_296898 [Athelia psychrophila]|uniref:Uncharacterized protein n=1 Tax=Athelia psychrophila TaxID=1759441 RepID=A0A167X9B6_9AGAM|nr:hypothetical protein FIBSPDRAFT_296898 [Fibularhizoctonia sp. CBS 109695]
MTCPSCLPHAVPRQRKRTGQRPHVHPARRRSVRCRTRDRLLRRSPYTRSLPPRCRGIRSSYGGAEKPYTPTLITSNTSPVLSHFLSSLSTPRTPVSAELNHHHHQIPPLRAAISINFPHLPVAYLGRRIRPSRRRAGGTSRRA